MNSDFLTKNQLTISSSLEQLPGVSKIAIAVRCQHEHSKDTAPAGFHDRCLAGISFATQEQHPGASARRIPQTSTWEAYCATMRAEDFTKNCCQILAVLWPTVSDDYKKRLDNKVVKLVEEIPESRGKLTSKIKVEMKLQSARMKGLLDLQDTVAAGDHLQLRRVGKDKKDTRQRSQAFRANGTR
eukprot:jgi/Ulvmu1/9040/UM005_0132.1